MGRAGSTIGTMSSGPTEEVQEFIVMDVKTNNEGVSETNMKKSRDESMNSIF